jgi:hypothetical protein
MKKKYNFLLALMLISWVLFCTACVGLKSELWIEPDGSGKLQVEYRMPKEMVESFKNGEHGFKVIDYNGIEIPEAFSEANLRSEIGDSEKRMLNGYDVRQEEEDIFISFTIYFSETAELETLEMIPKTLIETEGQKIKFSQVVCVFLGDEKNNPEVKRLYHDYKMTFIVHAPRQILSHNMGELSEDKRTLVFEYNLLDPKQDECVLVDGKYEDLQLEW